MLEGETTAELKLEECTWILQDKREVVVTLEKV